MPPFTRSTVVEPLIKIRQERLLSMRGEVIARVGQEVTAGQVVARSLGDPDYVVIAASETLRIPPDDLNKLLEVQIGERVEAGSLLVRKRGLMGGKSLVSPIEGTLYDVKNGRLILQRSGDWVELRALMPGRVVNQIPGRGVVLETHGTLIQGVWGSGKAGFGKIKIVTRSADAHLISGQLNDESTNHILVAGRIIQVEALQKAAELEVSGIITGSMSAILCQFAMTLNFPIMITEGIGTYRMAQPIFQLLQQMAGREASLFARQPDQSGSRPEIAIPGDTIPTIEPPSGRKPLTVGQTVRILRAPYASQIGEVVRLYTYAQTTSVGHRARGVDVKLSDGNIVFVPYANLDALI